MELFWKKDSCKHVRFRDAWFIYTSLKTAAMVIYPRLPVLAPEVRCFFLYVFGVQSYLLTFGVWKPRDSCKMLKQKPYRKHFLPQGIAQEIFKIFANHQDDPRYQVTKLPFPHGCFFGNLEPQGQPLKNGWKW